MITKEKYYVKTLMWKCLDHATNTSTGTKLSVRTSELRIEHKNYAQGKVSSCLKAFKFPGKYYTVMLTYKNYAFF